MLRCPARQGVAVPQSRGLAVEKGGLRAGCSPSYYALLLLSRLPS